MFCFDRVYVSEEYTQQRVHVCTNLRPPAQNHPDALLTNIMYGRGVVDRLPPKEALGRDTRLVQRGVGQEGWKYRRKERKTEQVSV